MLSIMQDKHRASRELQQLQEAMNEAKRQAQKAELETARAKSQLAALKRDAVDAELARDRAKHAEQLSSEVRRLPPCQPWLISCRMHQFWVGGTIQ